MDTLELFEETDFQGACISIRKDFENLADVGFLKRAKSLRVTGEPWVVFKEKNYCGYHEIYKEGKYSSIPALSEEISSVRKKTAKMDALELFEETDFQGASISIRKDFENLADVGFLKRAKSLRVTGEPWVVFKEKNYCGYHEIYKEGKYSSIPALSEEISSVRIIQGGLYDPKITVFEHINYGGRAATITEATRSLKAYEMDNMISSHKVESGLWTLYEDENFHGRSMVYVAGDNVPNYVPLGWNDVVSSLKPTVSYT